jgi:hypothetical protein
VLVAVAAGEVVGVDDGVPVEKSVGVTVAATGGGVRVAVATGRGVWVRVRVGMGEREAVDVGVIVGARVAVAVGGSLLGGITKL